MFQMTHTTYLRIVDAIELRAVERGNGFIHLTAGKYKGHAHGLHPERNGAGCFHAIKHLDIVCSNR